MGDGMRQPPRLMPALVTPFDRAGELELAHHRHNLGWLHDLGLGGFLLGGSTGEGPLLETGERTALVRAARAHLGRRPFLLVGVVAESVRQAFSQIEEAEGADGVLVLTPTTLARSSLPAQRRFFTAVAEASPLPVLLYSVPRNTGYALDEELAVELSAHPNIVGMKDSGGDAVRVQRIVAAAGTEFSVFNGSTASVMLAMAGGAYGAITASTNYLPSRMSELLALAKRRSPAANDLQTKLTGIAAHVESHGIGGVKAAAGHIGLRPGIPRLPLTEVSVQTIERSVLAALRKAT